MKSLKVFYLLGALLCATPVLAYAIKKQLDNEYEWEESMEQLYFNLTFHEYVEHIKQKRDAAGIKQALNHTYKPYYKRGGSKYL